MPADPPICTGGTENATPPEYSVPAAEPGASGSGFFIDR